MHLFLSILYVLVCFFLILVVLLQSGRGGGMGAAFGGASSQTVFGGAGAGNVLTRLTAIGAALFMLLSATLAYMSSTSETALERAKHQLEAREAARSGAPVNGEQKAPKTPKPAGMSVPEAQGQPSPAKPTEAKPAEPKPAPAEGKAPTKGNPAKPAAP